MEWAYLPFSELHMCMFNISQFFTALNVSQITIKYCQQLMYKQMLEIWRYVYILFPLKMSYLVHNYWYHITS